MHDFSQWLQSADGMDWTPILIAGILISLAIAVTCESVMAIFAALACACSLAGLPSYTLKSEIEQVWGLQEVSSECDLPDHDLPTRNMKCYVTNGKDIRNWSKFVYRRTEPSSDSTTRTARH